METAINGLWDGAPGPGDRIAVIGAGVVGALIGALAARLPGAVVELIDIDPVEKRWRRPWVAALPGRSRPWAKPISYFTPAARPRA